MSDRSIRMLGLTLEDVAHFRDKPTGKNSGLYASLDKRFEVVGIAQPYLGKLAKLYNYARWYHPDKDYWRQRSALSLYAFKEGTRQAEHLLRTWEGQYDVIMQLHTMLAPHRTLPLQKPYVLNTDNTYIISERLYPQWSPLRNGRQRDERVALERYVYQNAAFLFPRSEFVRHSLIEDYGCDPQRVIAVGGGSNFSPVPIADKRYDRQIALFVGLDFERKGGLVLLQAWEQVRQKLPQAELWIVGPPKPIRNRPGIRWLGLVKNRTVLADIYRQASLFVMPSLFEPWGHVFLEAMSNGLACIGTNCCAMPEIIDDAQTGYLVERGEPEPLAQAMVRLLEDGNLAQRMGHLAQAAVQCHGTWDHVVERMMPYIQEAVEQKPGKR